MVWNYISYGAFWLRTLQSESLRFCHMHRYFGFQLPSQNLATVAPSLFSIFPDNETIFTSAAAAEAHG